MFSQNTDRQKASSFDSESGMPLSDPAENATSSVLSMSSNSAGVTFLNNNEEK